MAVARPPVVTILGHVDHGKTTLLDNIRKSTVAKGEHGGITQKIGAYEVSTGIKGYHTDKITFIDTPGHEAYSKLRARGANVADIALLIIDAKDSLKPQTKESIAHIKAANLPFIVVINKIDIEGANADRVKIDLLKEDVITEDKGGKVPALTISALTGRGVPELLESILLLAAELHLAYDPAHPPLAYVIETKKDRRGVAASIIIKDGILKVGDTVYAETQRSKIRALMNDRGQSIQQIVPSTPVELLGFSDIPPVGALITVEKQDSKKEIVTTEIDTKKGIADLFDKKEGKRLSIIIRADSHGSLEAVLSSLTDKENVDVIASGVGAINKSDIFLAKTTKSIIIGFQVVPDREASDLSKHEKVVIKTYKLIYELLEELIEVSDLMKERDAQIKNMKGTARILATFIIGGDTVYGVRINKGKANIGDKVELYRDDKLVGTSKLVSLKVHARPVEEIKKDQEAGMLFTPSLDIKVGDMIKFIL